MASIDENAADNWVYVRRRLEDGLSNALATPTGEVISEALLPPPSGDGIIDGMSNVVGSVVGGILDNLG